MAADISNADGFWITGGAFTTAPLSTQQAIITTRVVLPANSSAAVCSSYKTSGTGAEICAQGPNSYLTVNSVKIRFGTVGYMESGATAATAVPRGNQG